MIAENDAKGIAPGSNVLEAIFKKCAPCLILIDEWVAYLRQIYKVEGLPSGSFDANLTFVQSLTEAVKASPGTLARRVTALLADRGRRRRRTRGAGAAQADLFSALNPRGGRPRRKRATRSCAAGCSRRFRETSITTRTTRSSSSRSSTAKTPTSFRRAAPTRTTGASSRRLIRSIPNCSTSSIRAGDRWRSFSAPAACCG